MGFFKGLHQFMGNIDPVAGLMTGQGHSGKMWKKANIIGEDKGAEEDKDTFAGTKFKKGGKVKGSSASKRADGIAKKGKTKGRMV